MAIFGRVFVSFVLVNLSALADEDSSSPEKKISGPVIGIDLGTTFSCVAVMRESGVDVIPNDQGNRITPSYVAFTKSGRLLGEAAKNEAAAHPTQTVFDIKRLIGRKYYDEVVQEDIQSLPYKVQEEDGKLKVLVAALGEVKYLTPEEISAMVLSKMKETAEAFLGQEVKHAVITVPAYFNNAQREATKDAGTIAGLDVLRIINEPTAAAIAYGLDKKDESNILVYDLGGGTFDVSLLTVAEGAVEVIATNGDTHLGGEDFDLRVAEHLRTLFEEKHKKDLSSDKKAFHKLKQAAEKAKISLSSVKETVVEVEGLVDGIDLVETLTRAKFEELNKDLFRKTLEPLKRVLEDGKMQKGAINEIVTVGGSTRIPKIQELLKSFFAGKETNRKLNPDEAVAYGAAVQAGVLSGVAADNIVLLDVTPISLGMETNGGIFDKIIPRNTALPVKKSRSYVTSAPDITETHIKVYEGERKMVADNNELGRFVLGGFPRAPKGLAHEVTFEVDANGILKVSAKITASGKENSMTITKDKQRLSSSEIEDMVKEAERFAEEDAKAELKARNVAEVETFIKDTQYVLGKMRKNMTDEEADKVAAKVDEALELKKHEVPEDVPAKIPDPDSEKPSDWDDDEDGDWEPAMIDNPAFKGISELLGEIKSVVEPILAKYPLPAVDEKAEEDKEEEIEDDPELAEDADLAIEDDDSDPDSEVKDKEDEL